MTNGSRYVAPYAYAFLPTGVPIPGALLYFWVTESSTPSDTYKTPDLTGERNTNPVAADAAGTFPSIFLDPAVIYKVRLTKPVALGGAEVWTADPVYVVQDNSHDDTSGGPPPTTEAIPTGAVMPFAQGAPPDGWLECNGADVSRTLYADLYSVIGTSYGAGDGINTFTVPDLRGEFVRGWDDGRGVDTGRSLGTPQASAFASHSHANTASNTVIVGDGSHHHTMFSNYLNDTLAFGLEYIAFGTHNDEGNEQYKMTSGVTPDVPFPGLTPTIGITADAMAGITVEVDITLTNAAAGGADTRPRNVSLLYCIKT